MKYEGKKKEHIIFPLGGIGTGSIGLTAEGRLVDFEIFNRPNKGSLNGHTHFAIRAICDGGVEARILNGDLTGNYMGQYETSYSHHGYGYGPSAATMAGFPHFKEASFDASFPKATLTFAEQDFPVSVEMTAFNPLIPNDADASSLPAAFFSFRVTNTQSTPLCAELLFSVKNPFSATKNTKAVANGCHVLTLAHADGNTGAPDYGELAVATDAEDAFIQCNWFRGEWQDALVTYANELFSPAGLREREYPDAGVGDTGTVSAAVTLLPKESKTLRFVLAWYVPNRINDWSPLRDENGKDIAWKNYYATVFGGAEEIARYAIGAFDSLFARTERFAALLHGATLPEEVIDAASANLAVLKSPTVLRLQDGSFYGWEGVTERAGSCEGTCQHVWSYAYALPFLFPSLERSVRDLEFKYSMDENGRMPFRLMLPLGRPMSDFRACVDGQMGTVFKCYREWKLSGDNRWLADHWNDIKRALAYAWSESNPDAWDRNRDGILEGCQHHTLDMELYSPSSWLEGMYLLALKTASEMASFLGDTAAAEEYDALYRNGKEYLNSALFNGKYFVQKIDLSDKSLVEGYEGSHRYWNDEARQIKYQVGEGCLLDQMLAAWHADLLGAGEIFDASKTDIALDSMMKYNFKPTMRGHINPWRLFSLNDEAGAVICAYPPEVEKPNIPISYCEETMTGFEYAFAGLLISRGHVEDGLRVVRAVRGRFDGERRNPWNEFECGSNYARSMASYALIPIFSGFTADLPHGKLGFAPKTDGDFRAPFSLDGAWGEFVRTADQTAIVVEEGALTLSALTLPYLTKVNRVTLDGRGVDFSFADGVLTFPHSTFKEISIQ